MLVETNSLINSDSNLFGVHSNCQLNIEQRRRTSVDVDFLVFIFGKAVHVCLDKIFSWLQTGKRVLGGA